jgi:hypothetical protein
MQVGHKQTARARLAALCHADPQLPDEPEDSESMRDALTTLVVRTLDGDCEALLEFPLLLATTRERPIEWLHSLDFHVSLIGFIDSANEDVIDAVLFILSDLVLVPNAAFLQAVLFTKFLFRGQEFQLSGFLIAYLPDAPEPALRVQSILYLLSQISTVFPEIVDAFSDFALMCLHDGSSDTKAVAAMVSVFLIRAFPMSPFATHVISELPFDGDDLELSHHCFNAILAMLLCVPPNPFCFEVGDMFRFAFTPLARDALRVLIQATAVLFSKAEQVSLHVDELLQLFTEFPAARTYVCCIVSNCVSVGQTVAERFLPLIPHFSDPALDDSPTPVKCELARAIASILLYSEVPLDPATCGATFELLEACLTLPSAPMQTAIIDLLVRAGWESDGFRDALEQLAEIPTAPEGIADLAALVLECQQRPAGIV